MNTFVFKFQTNDKELLMKQFSLIHDGCTVLQDPETVQDEGIHVCQKRIQVQAAFEEGKTFTITPGTYCLLWAIDELFTPAYYDYPECQGVFQSCQIGVLSPKQDADIYALFKPYSLIVTDRVFHELAKDDFLSRELFNQQWSKGLDRVARLATAWNSYHNGYAEYAIADIVELSKEGSFRAYNLLSHITDTLNKQKK